MPSQILHTLFGEDLIAGIDKRLERETLGGGQRRRKLTVLIEAHRSTFALGCQGPDIFYHNRHSRPVGLEYGTLLHRRGMGSFSSRLLELTLPNDHFKEHSPILAAYALGFMTHAFLDRSTHPFIVYKSCRLPLGTQGPLSDARLHAFFERILDVLMLKQLRGLDLASWDGEGLLAQTCREADAPLKVLLQRALTLTFPERAGNDANLISRIENAFTDAVAFYHFSFTARSTRQLPVRKEAFAYLHPVDLPRGIDFLNEEKRTWCNPAPDGKEDSRSFLEVYAEALEAAVNSLFPVFSHYVENACFLREDAELAIGNGGLSITDKNGKPAPPCRTEPLPLEEVLERQIRAF